MTQALSGIRVLDLSEGIAGPFGARMLADFGAEVIKVEPPTGDCSRTLGPFPGDVEDIERSALFLDLNRNKRGVTLDVFQPDGRALLNRLIEQADAVILSYSPREIEELHLDYESLRAINPRIVVTAITPWGLTGPYRDYRASEIVLDAFGHSMSIYGVRQREPLALGGGVRQRYAGEFAALATLSACVSAERSGIGQLLDLSMIEAHLGSIDRRAVHLLRYAYTGRLIPRAELGAEAGNVRRGFHPCADGFVHTSFLPQHLSHEFGELGRLIGHPEWADDPRFQPIVDKINEPEINHELSAAFWAWAMRHTKGEIAELARARQLPIFPVNQFSDVLDDPHFQQRDFWAAATHPVAGPLRYPGAPFRMSAGGYELIRPAPLLGQHNAEVYGGWLGLSSQELADLDDRGIIQAATAASDEPRPLSAARLALPRPQGAPNRLPLEGIRVLDMTAVWAGPATTMLLGDLGAEVIRVESIQFFPHDTRGFLVRPRKDDLEKMFYNASSYVDFDPGERPWNRFAGFNVSGRNKLSMTADLRRPEGVEIFKRLVEISDVIVDNSAFGVMEKLGLGDDVLRAINPRLINVSMPMFGNSGPYRATRGQGSVADVLSGFLSMRGYREFDLSLAQPVTHMDSTTGPSASFAVLCALRERDRTGRGQFIDFAQCENLLQAAGEYFLDYQWNGRNPSPLGNRDREGGIQGCYPSREADTWVVLTVRTDADWARLVEAIGHPAWAHDARFATRSSRLDQHDELDVRIAEWTSQLPAEEAMRRLQEAGVPAAKVMSEGDIFDDPHIRERAFFIETIHADSGTHLYPGHQWKASGTPLRADAPAPLLGEHNEYVYKDLLGYSDEAYQRLTDEMHIGSEFLPGLQLPGKI